MIDFAVKKLGIWCISLLIMMLTNWPSMLHLLESLSWEGEDCLLKTEWAFTALTGSQGTAPSRSERMDEIARAPLVAGELSFMMVIPLAIRVCSRVDMNCWIGPSAVELRNLCNNAVISLLEPWVDANQVISHLFRGYVIRLASLLFWGLSELKGIFIKNSQVEKKRRESNRSNRLRKT